MQKPILFSLGQLNAAIRVLLDELNDRPMRHLGQSRRQMFEAIERAALAPLPKTSFLYAEWKTAKVHPVGTLFDSFRAYSPTEQCVPAVVDDAILPDMGRMNARSQRAEGIEHRADSSVAFVEVKPGLIVKMTA